jgi:uncharacterized protein
LNGFFPSTLPLEKLMRRSRLVVGLIGAGICLGLLGWLVASLSQFYIAIAATNPLLANTILWGILLVILLGAGAIAYYFWQAQVRTNQKQRPIQLPEQKSAVAAQNIQAVRQQVAQIQDEIARQALQLRSQSLEQQFTRQELQIVVFGTGSAGKTSLVNALMGRVVGETSPTLGTTTVGQTYQLQLKNMPQTLLVTDTPGLLEVGVAGTEREKAARQLATVADLILFVIDADLTQSEYQPLNALRQIGKRLMLVFNKTDRYTEADRDAILQRLQQRLGMDPTDIVAIAAHPQAFQTPAGEWVQPQPILIPLVRRLVTILRAEGEDLLADNLLLQSQRLGEDVRQLLNEQRQKQSDRIIQRFQWIGAGVIWVTPIPMVDLLATAAVNTQMVVELGRIYGCDINLERAKELVLSLVKTMAGLGIVTGAIELVTTVLELSVGGYVIGKGIQSITAAYLTRIAGKSFMEYFGNDQDWGDGGISAVVQRQFQLNRRDEFVKEFVKDAITHLPREFNQVARSQSEHPQ